MRGMLVFAICVLSFAQEKKEQPTRPPASFGSLSLTNPGHHCTEAQTALNDADRLAGQARTGLDRTALDRLERRIGDAKRHLSMCLSSMQAGRGRQRWLPRTDESPTTATSGSGKEATSTTPR